MESQHHAVLLYTYKIWCAWGHQGESSSETFGASGDGAFVYGKGIRPCHLRACIFKDVSGSIVGRERTLDRASIYWFWNGTGGGGWIERDYQYMVRKQASGLRAVSRPVIRGPPVLGEFIWDAVIGMACILTNES